MNGDLQARIKPHSSPNSRDFSQAKVSSASPEAQDSTDANKTSFKDLISNSNTETVRARLAQKNGDAAKSAKTDEEFARLMQDKANKENLRVPSNKLDKDSFLKLFITQLQNQDPLNPDDSSEMASQLAQFDGLEQMLNVNKNLEKLSNEQAIGRAVSLIDFVGKEVKLDNGKLLLKSGKLTDATYAVDADVPKASLEVRDAAGVIVAQKDLGFLKVGDHKLEWDGTDSKGKKLNDGVYTFSVVGKDAQDQDVPVKISSAVKITGVDLSDQGGAFYSELGKIRVNEVSSVGDSGFMRKGAVPAAEKVKGEAPGNAIKAAAAQDEPELSPEAAAAAAAAAIKAANLESIAPPEASPGAARAGSQATSAAAPASQPEEPKVPTPSAIPTVIDIPVPGASS